MKKIIVGTSIFLFGFTMGVLTAVKSPESRPVALEYRPLAICDTIKYYPWHKILVDDNGRCYMGARCPDSYEPKKKEIR